MQATKSRSVKSEWYCTECPIRGNAQGPEDASAYAKAHTLQTGHEAAALVTDLCVFTPKPEHVEV